MIIGIDAANIHGRGSQTHLLEILKAADPKRDHFKRIVVWSCRKTLNLFPEREWLKKINPPALEGNLIQRVLWQKRSLPGAIKDENCDLLFIPGGNRYGEFNPVVTICQNMLPYEWRELKRYGISWMTLKILLLRYTQSKSFKESAGVIFLSEYARQHVEQVTGELAASSTIAHGLDSRFFTPPRVQKPITDYSETSPFRIVYISGIDPYKHHLTVVEAINHLRLETGWDLTLELAGPLYKPTWKKLKKCMQRYDPKKEWITYHGLIPYSELHRTYQDAELALFASSCENLPITLLEMMASGLPIASSTLGPMPEVLGEAGLYFHPEQPGSIAGALKRLISSPELRSNLSMLGYKKAALYSWKECAIKTFSFLSATHKQYQKEENRE